MGDRYAHGDPPYAASLVSRHVLGMAIRIQFGHPTIAGIHPANNGSCLICKPIELQRLVNLIAATRATTGLQVACQLDTNTYPTGVKVSDTELAQVKPHRESFHGEWNYAIKPRE